MKMKTQLEVKYQGFVCLLSFSSRWVKVMLVLMSSRQHFQNAENRVFLEVFLYFS